VFFFFFFKFELCLIFNIMVTSKFHLFQTRVVAHSCEQEYRD